MKQNHPHTLENEDTISNNNKNIVNKNKQKQNTEIKHEKFRDQKRCFR